MKSDTPGVFALRATRATLGGLLLLSVVVACGDDEASDQPGDPITTVVVTPAPADGIVAPQPSTEMPAPRSAAPTATPPVAPEPVAPQPVAPNPAPQTQVPEEPAPPTLDLPGFEPRAGY